VDSGKFLSNRIQLRVIERASTIAKQLGNQVVTSEFDELVGYGPLMLGSDRVHTSWYTVVFRNGKPYTGYPLLEGGVK